MAKAVLISIRPESEEKNANGEKQTRLEDGALWDYGKGATLYGWHISKLEIYDTPKKLSKFLRPFENCIGKVCDEYGCAYCENGHIKRPPQSWCYVEELK